MVEELVFLDLDQREIVNKAVRDHCDKRLWHLFEVNCRSNHCHVVLTATNYDGEQVRDQLKGWAKRRLKADQLKRNEDGQTVREHWWTRKGSVRYLYDEESLQAAIAYTLEAQDLGGSKYDEIQAAKLKKYGL